MKLSKVFSIITIAVMLLASASSVVLAGGITVGNITLNPSTSSNAAQKVTNIGNNIVGIFQTVGSVAAVATLIVLGIKYMMGSAEEKAEYKKTLVPYAIGAILVLAAVNIINWVVTAGQSLLGA